jgi:hypothetical protein
MYHSVFITITRKFAALVLGVHAAALSGVAAAATRREEKAWQRVENTQQEIEQLEMLVEVQEYDAAIATSAADDIHTAVAAELGILPFINKP